MAFGNKGITALLPIITEVLNHGDESVSVAFEEVDAADWAEKVYKPDIVSKSELLYKKPGYSM